MPEKIKITKAEFEELYEITDGDQTALPAVPTVTLENTEFEIFTETYDKEHEKEFREET